MASTARTPRVTQGAGMFNLPKASFSKETQDLLKVMMNESKLTNFQQRQLKTTLKNGRSLPLECNPTSSSPGNGGKPAAKKTPRRSHVPSKQGLRTRDTINKLVESTDKDDYCPRPTGYDATKEKARLQNVMAFGKDLEPPKAAKARQPVEEDEEVVDRFEEVLGEIEERKQFLEDMAALGQDKPHRHRIMTEISQRVRELKEIDKARCAEILTKFNHSSTNMTTSGT